MRGKLRKLYRDRKKVNVTYFGRFLSTSNATKEEDGEDDVREEEEEKVNKRFLGRERETKARSHARENVQIKQSNKERRIFNEKKKEKRKKKRKK